MATPRSANVRNNNEKPKAVICSTKAVDGTNIEVIELHTRYAKVNFHNQTFNIKLNYVYPRPGESTIFPEKIDDLPYMILNNHAYIVPKFSYQAKILPETSEFYDDAYNPDNQSTLGTKDPDMYDEDGNFDAFSLKREKKDFMRRLAEANNLAYYGEK